MMNKNSVKGYAILGILFALVSVVVFAVPTAKTPAFWIAYGFTVVAFAVQSPLPRCGYCSSHRPMPFGSRLLTAL